MADETNETSTPGKTPMQQSLDDAAEARARASRAQTYSVATVTETGERTYTTIPLRQADPTAADAQWKRTTSSPFTQRHPNTYRALPAKPAPTPDVPSDTSGVRREEALAYAQARLMIDTIMEGLWRGLKDAAIAIPVEDGPPDEVLDPAMAKVAKGFTADVERLRRLCEGQTPYQVSLTLLRRLGFALDWAPAEALGGESHDEH